MKFLKSYSTTVFFLTLFCTKIVISQTLNVSYLSPQMGTTGTYKFLRVGTSSEYFAGFMNNMSDNSFGDGNDFSIFTYGNRDMTFNTGTGNVIIFPNSGGNVGIGTRAPSAKLEVNGTIRGQDFITVQTGSAYKVAINGQSDGYIRGRDNSFTNKFQIAANGYSYLNGGNVGIGTTAPSAGLEVKDDNGIRIQSKQNGGWLGSIKMVDGLTNTSSRDDMEFSTSGGFMFKMDDNGNGISNVQGFNVFDRNENSVFTIQETNGNVGIGTDAPDAPLTVNGQIHAQEVKVDLLGAVAPDYVFYKDYPLRSLEEVQHHIDTFGHLPNIPSAAQMAKEGLHLKEMNLKLLEKIEELTLYLLNEHRENQQMKSKIRQLEKAICIEE